MRHFAVSADATATVVNHVQARRPVRSFVVDSNGQAVEQIDMKFVTIGYAKS